eukprot:1143529-Pelagomonas_calceolata.AAC.1
MTRKHWQAFCSFDQLHSAPFTVRYHLLLPCPMSPFYCLLSSPLSVSYEPLLLSLIISSYRLFDQLLSSIQFFQRLPEHVSLQIRGPRTIDCISKSNLKEWKPNVQGERMVQWICNGAFPKGLLIINY